MELLTAGELDAYVDNDVFIQLVADNVQASAVALSDANAEAYGYIRGSYSTAFATSADVPETLKRAVADLWCYHIHRRTVPDWAKFRYTRAIDWLKDVSRGLVKLTVTDGSLLPEGDTPSPYGAAIYCGVTKGTIGKLLDKMPGL